MSIDEGPILVATDFSDDADNALRAAARLAKEWNVRLDVLHCLEWAADLPTWSAPVSESTTDEYRSQARRRLESHVEETVPGSEQPESISFDVQIEFPEDALLERLDGDDYGLGVLGATGLNRVANFFLGSVPEDVVRRSAVPILVVPDEGTTDGYDHIVAPVDFNSCSRRALNRAADLARREDARLTIVHAVPVMADVEATPMPGGAEAGVVDEMRDARSEQFDEFIEHTPLEGLEWDRRQDIGSPHDVVVDTVDELGADLVVMGTHGRRGFERLFLGSTATKILRRMPCSVMTIRSRETGPSE